MEEQKSARGGSPKIPVLPSGYRETVSEGDVEVLVYYLGCLAQASYIVRDRKAKTAFVIDPRRDVDVYLQELAAHRTRLKGVLLTHVHADFVSGHMELSRRGDADIFMGPNVKSRTSFDIVEVKDGQMIELSPRYSLKGLHTPGHTPESVSWVLVETTGASTPPAPLYAFTGDTLFIGSCGRPDLVGSLGYTADGMARLMYASLWNRLMQLPDSVKVFPAHGAGSPCGKSLSDALWSTIGDERKTNPALQIEDIDAFVAFLTCGQPHSPRYFMHSVQQNLAGAGILKSDILSVPWISATQAQDQIRECGGVLLDTRTAQLFAVGHLPGALNIGQGAAGGTVLQPYEGNFAIWVGTLVPQTEGIYIIASAGEELGALERLARIGFKAHAVVIGGAQEWLADGLTLDTHQLCYPQSQEDLASLSVATATLLDVRTPDEYAANHMRAATNWPLASIGDFLDSADRSKTYYCHCASGFRSSIAVSCLTRAGLDAVDLLAGFANLSVRFTDHTTKGMVCPVMRKTAEDMEKLYVSPGSS